MTELRLTIRVQPWLLQSVRAPVICGPCCLRARLAVQWLCLPWACGHHVHLLLSSSPPRPPCACAAPGRLSALQGFTFSRTLWSPPREGLPALGHCLAWGRPAASAPCDAAPAPRSQQLSRGQDSAHSPPFTRFSKSLQENPGVLVFPQNCPKAASQHRLTVLTGEVFQQLPHPGRTNPDQRRKGPSVQS